MSPSGKKVSQPSDHWLKVLKYDPREPLSTSSNDAVAFYASRELLGRGTDSPKILWDLPIPKEILRKQQQNGSWIYPGGNVTLRSSENYNQLETYRNLGYLVDMYGFTNQNPAIVMAADYLFRSQTSKGDIRGILGSQYSPYYTAGIAELLIKAGYVNDDRIENIFKWLSGMRQDDGGWAIPLRTRGKNLDVIASPIRPLESDRTKPFSHLVTGMVLRAYAAHPMHRKSVEAKVAGDLLLSRFFKADSYPDRNTPSYWLRFSYPFWFTDLLSAMDSLSKLGFSYQEPQIAKGVQWFVSNQKRDGLWNLKALKNQRKFETELWLDLSICRVLKRLYSKNV